MIPFILEGYILYTLGIYCGSFFRKNKLKRSCELAGSLFSVAESYETQHREPYSLIGSVGG